jgi:hypothetical protein
MDAKLTLKLDKVTIEKAKLYAESRKTSLSKLIEGYLQMLTKGNAKKEPISPLVKSLSGVIELPDDFDEKADYGDYLERKYSK